VAPTRSLLTAAQLRAAAGLAAADTSKDTELAAIGLAVSDTISEWCNVVGDGITPVTLRQETLIETLWPAYSGRPLILSRRFLGTVTIVENAVALVSADFSINAGAGILTRLSSDAETYWPAGKIVVTYQAGFATVPTPLVDVASDMVSRKLGVTRDPVFSSLTIPDPALRSLTIPDVVAETYLVDAEGLIIPSWARSVLERYRTLAV
jgi:hypothetical protein